MQKKSVQLMGHKTSISLEPEFWQALSDLAKQKNTSIRQIIIQIDTERSTNLASAIRVYILSELKKQLSEQHI